MRFTGVYHSSPSGGAVQALVLRWESRVLAVYLTTVRKVILYSECLARSRFSSHGDGVFFSVRVLDHY